MMMVSTKPWWRSCKEFCTMVPRRRSDHGIERNSLNTVLWRIGLRFHRFEQAKRPLRLAVDASRENSRYCKGSSRRRVQPSQHVLIPWQSRSLRNLIAYFKSLVIVSSWRCDTYYSRADWSVYAAWCAGIPGLECPFHLLHDHELTLEHDAIDRVVSPPCESKFSLVQIATCLFCVLRKSCCIQAKVYSSSLSPVFSPKHLRATFMLSTASNHYSF